MERFASSESSSLRMERERAISAYARDGRSSAVARAEDDGFRADLERSVASGFRLAAAILGNPTDAEDATQDALERAWRARTRLRDPDHFDAWFQRIVVNACRDRMRRHRSGPTILSLIERDSDRVVAADQSDVNANRDALRAALNGLNADQRIVIAMRFYLDLQVDEIARRLGARSGTVKSRLHRGLQQLRLAREGER